jgi:RHS repeat-associated protein
MSRFDMRSLMITLAIALLAPQLALAHPETDPQPYTGGSLGDVTFTNPDLQMESGGDKLIWHKEAQSSDSEACTRPAPKWGGEGYVKTQWRKLNPDLTPYVGALWKDASTFSPDYTSCSGGRWFAEDYRSLGTATKNWWWPYWEIRHVKPSEASLQSPSTIYMHAQTTRIEFPCHPTNLRRTTYLSNSVELEWEDCTPDEDHYEILRATSLPSGWTVIGTAPANATSFLDTSVTPSAFYFYRVRPVDETGSSHVVSRTLPVKGALVDGTAFRSNPDSFGLVEFPDPHLKLSDDGTKLLWTKEATAPTCSWSYWDTNNLDDTDFVYMQVRKLDENGLAAGNWSAVGPFSPNYTACQWGQWIESYSRNLGPSDRNWPFWEIRYVPPAESSSQNPSKVYLLARTTASGAGISPDQQRQCRSPDIAIKACDSQGDPVNSVTGAFESTITDLWLPGIEIPFNFRRSYSSSDLRDGPLGRGWQYSLEIGLSIKSNGTVVMRGETGQLLRFAKMPDGTFVPDSGGLTTLTTVPGGYKATHQDRTSYLFDSTGRLTSLTGRNGRGLTVAYGSDGLPNQVTDSVGRIINLTHDADGHLERVTLPDGRHVDYSYTNGLLSSVTDARGYVTTYEYDSDQRLTRITDQNNNDVITNTYNSDGRVVEQVDARGNETSLEWDPLTHISTATDARGHVWKSEYSKGGLLVASEDPHGNRIAFEYDEKLNLTRITDPRGHTTSMTYDSAGRMLTRTSPAPFSYEESWTYNNSNDVTSYTNRRGRTTSYDYDDAGNLVSITQPGNKITTFGRDPEGTGLLISLTNPRGKTTTYEHDTDGNLVEMTTPESSMTTITYDESGRMISMIEARGNEPGAVPDDYEWTYTYDNANNLQTVTDPLGHQTKWFYDPAGNLDKVIDAKDKTTDYAYNAANQLTQVEAPDLTTTDYQFDPNGNVSSRTDAEGHITIYEYDHANRLEKVTAPLNRVWTYTYDDAGNLETVVDAIGNSTPGDPDDGKATFSYDELSRLSGIDYSDSTPDVSFTYDANSNRASMTDGFGSETYAYDDLDRIKSVTRGAQSFIYDYDDTGNLIKSTYPDGTVTDYTFFDDNQLKTVTSGGNTTTYNYDAAGNLTSTILPAANGYVETRTYDEAGRVIEVKSAKAGAELVRNTFVLDEVGNPGSMTTQDGVVDLSYDDLYRLTKVCYDAPCDTAGEPYIHYTYDDVGNRLTETRTDDGSNPITTTYTYNAADELSQTSSSVGTNVFAYDLNGNQTSAGAWTYSYDGANRMITASDTTTSVAYSYDGEGKRLGATTTPQGQLPTEVNYKWDTAFALPEVAIEEDASGSVLRRYIYGHEAISMTADGADYYYHYDGLGSVTGVTDANGLPQWSYSYYPFGSSRSTTQLNALAPDNPIRFTGEYLDPTGLYHLRSRQYDPGLGRFTATDPLPAGPSDAYVSAYAYVNNRPTIFVDPSGLFCILGSNPNGSCRGSGSAIYNSDAWYDLNDSVGGLADGITHIPFTDTSLTGELRDHMVSGGIALGVNTCAWGYGYANRIGGLAQDSLALIGGGPPAVEKLAAWLAKTRHLGTASRLFGQVGGLLNKKFVRIGWGYKQEIGRLVFRISIGGKRAPIWWHFDIL